MEHSILVYLDAQAQSKPGTGKMYVCPVEIKTNVGDTIRWLCNYPGKFECTFTDGTPFPGHKVVKGEFGETEFHTAKDVGYYKYNVNEGKFERDPIIIVEPSD
jgi:plastocyanin